MRGKRVSVTLSASLIPATLTAQAQTTINNNGHGAEEHAQIRARLVEET